MVLSMERWVGKVAIVTGASAGIGAAIVEQLVEHGVNVVGWARRKELVESLSEKLKGKKGKVYARKVDVANENEIIDAFNWTVQNVGPVHILINNAGVLLHTNLMDGDADKWRKTFDINVIGLCIATREAVRYMKANNINGHIIHISSLAAYAVSDLIPNANVYPASKHAVRAIYEMLRMELRDAASRIKLSCVSPGPVDTDIVNDFKKYESVTTAFNDAMKSEDVADAVIYALSTPPGVQIQDVIMRPVSIHF